MTDACSRRAFVATAASIIAAPAAAFAELSIDEMAWHADAADEFASLIKAYDAARAIDCALGQALDDLDCDPDCPSVPILMSDIRPPLGITGQTWLAGIGEINEYFDGVINTRRRWAGADDRFEIRLESSREHALALLHDKAKIYEEWAERVAYAQHERRFQDAIAESDRLLEEILNYPCLSPVHASRKAQFVIEHPWEFRIDPERLVRLLSTIATGWLDSPSLSQI